MIEIYFEEKENSADKYLTPQQKAFIQANKALRANTRWGKESERTELVKTEYSIYEDIFGDIYIDTNVKKIKEVERNTYTEHVYEDGTVIGEVERVKW